MSRLLPPAASVGTCTVAATCLRRPTPCFPPRLLLRSTVSRRTLYGYTQAKALIYSRHGQPKDVLQLHTHSLPPPHGSLLTLRTLATPLNPADINQIQGTYASLPAFTSALGTASGSAVPGNEGVFEVVAAGSGATSVRRGDWVIPRRTGLGTWRTHLQVAEAEVIRVDGAGLAAADVAGVSVNPVTAWRMLVDFVPLLVASPEAGTGPEAGGGNTNTNANASASASASASSTGSESASGDGGGGAWFVQNGANSGVGRAALQLARKWRIPNVAVVRARSTEAETAALRAELRRLGATYVVTEAEAQSKGFDLPARVRGWTSHPARTRGGGGAGAGGGGGGEGAVRLALNCVGGRPALALAKLLAPGGTMVTYGAMAKQPLTVPASMLIFKDLRFAGFWVSRWADANPLEKKRVVDEVLGMVRGGEFAMGPRVEVPWRSETGREELVAAVQGTLEGFRGGKGVFVFGK